MPTLICFGLGYSAENFIARFGDGFERIVGTARTAERAAGFDGRLDGRLNGIVFDGGYASPQLGQAIGEADVALVSAPPGEMGDPVLAVFGDALARAKRLRAIVYLSTIGVYGDHGGRWVDENTPTSPGLGRSHNRRAAEQAWEAFGSRCGKAVSILRLGGIYGPGQNALVQIKRGTARRIVKPGQVFNRIHVGDIAGAIGAAFERDASGIVNVIDDEPTPAGDPIVFAAQLLGVEPPPEIPFDAVAASMPPMALSFWQECRRVRNRKLKDSLGVVLRYPTYREGLRDLFEML